MKKFLIALVIAALLVVSGCGSTPAENTDSVSDADASATDVSTADVSAADVSVTDVPDDTAAEISASDGYRNCTVGNLSFRYPDTYAANVSDADMVEVSTDKSGAYFTVSKSPAVDMVVSELSKTDLDKIGESSADALKAALGDSADVVYTYKNHETALDGAGVCFEFVLTVDYGELDFSRELSFCQLYIAEGKDIYIATFASDPGLNGLDAAECFADVISSVKLNAQ